MAKGDKEGLKNEIKLMQQKSNYNKNLKPLARNLRNDSTMGEALLWNDLKSKKMLGYTFNRQFSIQLTNLNIIVDFICRKMKLIIEIDGYSHTFKVDEDKNRDFILQKEGYTVLRIFEHDVKQDIENVIRKIEITVSKLEKLQSQSPYPPSPRGNNR